MLLRADASFLQRLVLFAVLILLTGCASIGDLGISNLVDLLSNKDEHEVDKEEIATLKAVPEIPLLWKHNLNKSNIAVFSPIYEEWCSLCC